MPNPLTLIMLKGLPASGKSTFARNLLTHGFVRVNKDDIRRELLKPGETRPPEKEVLKERDFRIRKALGEGKSVVVDDTNLNPIHEPALRKIAREFDAKFEVKWFDVPLVECVARDAQRAEDERVGEQVIVDMFRKYMQNYPCDRTPKTDLPSVYLCDIDGTVALNLSGRPHYGRGADEGYLTDVPNYPVIQVIKALSSVHGIIFVSGREGTELGKINTRRWLEEHFGLPEPWISVYFRKAGDFRPDNIVKKEIYEQHIKPNYEVVGVFDDRPKVLEAWWELGLFVFDVGPHVHF